MRCADILDRARDARILVVGDICLDRWCRYDPALAEASRETGIPRHAVVRTETTPGAGGTVAVNLAALGAGRVSVMGAVGRDGFGHELRRSLAARGIESDRLVACDGIQTFTYTKLINAESGTEDLPRVDFVNTEPLEPAVDAEIVRRFRDSAPEFDAVVVADQAETESGGAVTEALRAAIGHQARARPGKVFIADSRKRIERFRSVIAVPNESEARAACLRVFGATDYSQLRRRIAGPLLVVTAGEHGAWLVDGSGTRLLPACGIGETVDVCGAGDSLAAGLALALAAGAGHADALAFGIIVAGITVGKPGTGYALPREVLAAERSAAKGD